MAGDLAEDLAKPVSSAAPAPPLSAGEVYGSAMHLLARSPAYRGAPLAAIDALIAIPLKLGQLKLYRRQGQPFAVAVWAFLSEAIETRILNGGGALAPEEWKSGERPFVIALVAPFGGTDSVRTDLKASLFASNEYREWFGLHGGVKEPMIRSAADPAISYRPARKEDVVALAPRLREDDLAEIKAATGMEGEAALAASLDNSKQAWSALAGNRVIAMFGVGRIENRPDAGLAWMLSAGEALTHPRAFLRDGPVWLRELMNGHKVIGNFISTENELYIRWLKRLGFCLVRRHAKFGVAKKPFWEFVCAEPSNAPHNSVAWLQLG